MNTENFEQELRSQPLRRIPAEWRDDILAIARRATSPRPAILDTQPRLWWRALLEPCPQAWAGLAAVWLVILVVNFSMRDEPHTIARRSPPPSPEVIVALQQQQRLLVELIGTVEKPAAGRPKPFQPQPRSDLRNETLTA
jgi:hypothetical protein